MAGSRSSIVQTAFAQLDIRHQPSGLNSSFDSSFASFSEYIQHTRSLILRARILDVAGDLNRIIDGNAAFELFPLANFAAGRKKPYRRGILLVHGLSDSPYFMRHLATFFQGQGFRVMAVLLPGHGTRPGDLLEVRWLEWQKAVEFGIEKLLLDVDEVYLAGFSAGGALSVYQCCCDQRVRGLFLFAPALKISAKAAWANLHKAYSWLIPSAQWLSIKPDTDIFKYESFPKQAVAQMYALTQAVQTKLARGKIQVPVFAAVSQDDATVDTTATIEFMLQVQNPLNKLVYYFSDAEKIPSGFPAETLELLNGVFPGKNIVSSAHTAIVLPYEDTYYGEQGEYRNCVHYCGEEQEKFEICSAPSGQVMQGEVTHENLKRGVIRRLMYNPNFTALKRSMRKFIDGLLA